MGTRFTLCTVLAACLVACGSNATTSDSNDESAGGGGGSTNVSGGGGAASGGGNKGANGGGSSGTGPTIVFNEVLAVGSNEWIEIVNPGSEPIDVSDYMIAGSDKGADTPKMKSAMKFPAGTTIEAGGRIVILTSRDSTEPVGPHARESCLPDGPDSCFYASFGVSSSTGESLHFIAPDETVLASTAIPAGLSAPTGGSTTTSSCRLPDLTGEFATCALTPGQPNRAQ